MSAWHPTEPQRAMFRWLIEANGAPHQQVKAAEEYAEASAAISRYVNGYGTLGEVSAELADTEIMRAQLCEIYPELPEAISRQRAIKLATTAMRFNFPEHPTRRIMKEYTLGFIFSPDLRTVYLIRKTHPDWQKGLLNGVGGHKQEITEGFHACMMREAYEEAGYTGDFTHYCTMGGTDWTCLVYYSVMHEGQQPPASREEEQIEAVRMSNILAESDQMISNLPWLILSAINHHFRPEFCLDVKY